MTAPKIVVKDGTNPLLVKCYDTLMTMLCGRVIAPWANTMTFDIGELAEELRREITGETPIEKEVIDPKKPLPIEAQIRMGWRPTNEVSMSRPTHPVES
jgi:hypothetical protein